MTAAEMYESPLGRALPSVGSTCRDYQHSWQPHDGGPEKGGYFRTLSCDRCSTERREHLDRWGFVVSRSYKYPQGFLVKGGGAMTPEERGLLRILHINPDAKLPRANRKR